jgi:hypothetical protein
MGNFSNAFPTKVLFLPQLGVVEKFCMCFHHLYLVQLQANCDETASSHSIRLCREFGASSPHCVHTAVLPETNNAQSR